MPWRYQEIMLLSSRHLEHILCCVGTGRNDLPMRFTRELFLFALLGYCFGQREHFELKIVGILQNFPQGRGGAGIAIFIIIDIKAMKTNDDQSFLTQDPPLDTALDNICRPIALESQIAQGFTIERMVHGKIRATPNVLIELGKHGIKLDRALTAG